MIINSTNFPSIYKALYQIGEVNIAFVPGIPVFEGENIVFDVGGYSNTSHKQFLSMDTVLSSLDDLNFYKFILGHKTHRAEIAESNKHLYKLRDIIDEWIRKGMRYSYA